MFNLIPISLLIIALGGIVYIISSHISEFSAQNGKDSDYGEDDSDAAFNLKKRFVDYINQLPLDNVKNQSISLTQKFLHRIRLILLKADNRLMKLIGKISERDKKINGNGNPPDFWENLSKIKEENKGNSNFKADSGAKIELAAEINEKSKKIFDINPVKFTDESDKSRSKKILRNKKSPK